MLLMGMQLMNPASSQTLVLVPSRRMPPGGRGRGRGGRGRGRGRGGSGNKAIMRGLQKGDGDFSRVSVPAANGSGTSAAPSGTRVPSSGWVPLGFHPRIFDPAFCWTNTCLPHAVSCMHASKQASNTSLRGLHYQARLPQSFLSRPHTWMASARMRLLMMHFVARAHRGSGV